MDNPLTTTCILTHLELRQWSGEVSDKKGLQAVAAAYNSDTHNDKYKKSLFVTDPLAPIQLCAGRLRNHFYHCTIPWLDGGKGRLTPGPRIQEFINRHSQLEMEFDQAVMEFLKDYEDHKDLAKEKKGELYNENEYPDVETLKERFSVKLITLPFPNTDDYRINATQEALDYLEDNMTNSMNAVADTVTEELWKRFEKRVGMLLKTLSVGKRFNSSLLTELANVNDMIFNLKDTVSKGLFEKAERAENLIINKYTPDELRNSLSIQKEAITLCKELMTK